MIKTTELYMYYLNLTLSYLDGEILEYLEFETDSMDDLKVESRSEIANSIDNIKSLKQRNLLNVDTVIPVITVTDNNVFQTQEQIDNFLNIQNKICKQHTEQKNRDRYFQKKPKKPMTNLEYYSNYSELMKNNARIKSMYKQFEDTKPQNSNNKKAPVKGAPKPL